MSLRLTLKPEFTHNGQPTTVVYITLFRRTFRVGQYKDHRKAERVHDALLVWFNMNEVALQGVPANPEFYNMVGARLEDGELLSAIVGIKGEEPGERFSGRMQNLLDAARKFSHAHTLKVEAQASLA